MTYHFSAIDAAIAQVRRGGLVIIMDSVDREYEGDFVGAAALATSETINFMVSTARGAYIAAFMPHGLCDRLDLPPMTGANEAFNNTQFRVSVDARSNTSGSSAFDRADTVRILGDPHATADDFVRPGHVVPISASVGGLTQRRGHTEAGVELLRLAGIDPPVAVDLEIMDQDGTMAREDALFDLARKFELPIISIDDLAEHANRVSTP